MSRSNSEKKKERNQVGKNRMKTKSVDELTCQYCGRSFTSKSYLASHFCVEANHKD